MGTKLVVVVVVLVMAAMVLQVAAVLVMAVMVLLVAVVLVMAAMVLLVVVLLVAVVLVIAVMVLLVVAAQLIPFLARSPAPILVEQAGAIPLRQPVWATSDGMNQSLQLGILTNKAASMADGQCSCNCGGGGGGIGGTLPGSCCPGHASTNYLQKYQA